MVARFAPEDGDVVIRQVALESTLVYVLHRTSTPNQVLLRTREEAVAQALAFAKRQHVRAWCANGDADFVLLGTFRKDTVEPARAS
jgi:phage-related baseplate assembly protein